MFIVQYSTVKQNQLFTPIQIKQISNVPKYIQIGDAIIRSIETGELEKGAKLPSINEICRNNKLARETVVKAFNQLKEKGLIASVHGKGFYISSTNTLTQNRVFLFFDTFTSYKETLYNAIKDAFGPNTILDIYFHHFNYEVFKNTIATHIGNYTAYIILPMNHAKTDVALKPVPMDKLFLLDIRPLNLKTTFNGVYQDFKTDIKETLLSIKHQIVKYNTFKLIFRNTITDLPKSLEKGFMEFCEEHTIAHEVRYDKISKNLNKGEGYIVIDDEDLVSLVEAAKENNFEIGRDIGIISYNDTPLKKVVGHGISVISTDFAQMGKSMVEMIQNNQRAAIRNKTTFVDRGSF